VSLLKKLIIVVYFLGFYFSDSIYSKAETPTQATDRYWAARQEGHPNWDKLFTLSREIARDQGTSVIAPIMSRSKYWKDEEVLFFVPLVLQIPYKKSVPILEWYFQNGTSSEKVCANDLLTEIQQWIIDHKEMTDAERKKLFGDWN
jgi:hypothetical protein